MEHSEIFYHGGRMSNTRAPVGQPFGSTVLIHASVILQQENNS
jgi:hypothetical protein